MDAYTYVHMTAYTMHEQTSDEFYSEFSVLITVNGHWTRYDSFLYMKLAVCDGSIISAREGHSYRLLFSICWKSDSLRDIYVDTTYKGK